MLEARMPNDIVEVRADTPGDEVANEENAYSSNHQSNNDTLTEGMPVSPLHQSLVQILLRGVGHKVEKDHWGSSKASDSCEATRLSRDERCFGPRPARRPDADASRCDSRTQTRAEAEDITMGLWTEAGSVPGLDVRLLSWIVEYLVFECLVPWHPRKQNTDVPCQDGNGNLIRITKPPALRCCQCSDTVTPEEKPNSESDHTRDPSPVLASRHDEPSLVEQYLPTNKHKIDGRVFSDPTSDQVYHELPTRESCKLVNIHDPLFVLLILLYNTYHYFDLTLLLPLPPSVSIIGVPTSFFFQPYWLLVILLDNDKGCRRRRWIAACSIVWIDDTFWRTLSGTLFAFALPELDSGRLRALLTLPNLAIQYPNHEVIEAPDGPGQTTPVGGHFEFAGRNNEDGSQAQSNRERGKSTRGRGQKRRGPGRGGAGRGGGGGGGGGDDKEQQESEDKPAKKAFACHFFKRREMDEQEDSGDADLEVRDPASQPRNSSLPQ
ncbi:hypothetical protein CKAH01_18462 [Colletotrichum kahawae]|uniref:Uncharacterized protein n=1 Tax=Colletotrichum kahawae TaxID=34407 RepID=A0AAE0D2V0_COLKA|nr:hypothetical protein CKAH01_18462 [Colletotrichum kahawae]